MSNSANFEKYGERWDREELILAFDLYCRIPFNKTKANNPEVIELGKILRRSPASVARKLGNFGSFDPELKKLQVKGLTHTGNLDREVWDEFNNNWNQLVLEAGILRNKLDFKQNLKDMINEDMEQPTGLSEKEGKTKVRIHQSFFREAILSSYEYTCCVTGLRINECLIASHIIPWSVDEKRRADPHNGLCLSATFDRLFDRGFITISESLHVVVGSELLESHEKKILDMICIFNDRPIIRPRRFLPSPDCLKWHHSNIFKR